MISEPITPPTEFEVVSFEIALYPYISEGIKDKRYKTGYRVLPSATVSTNVNLCVKNTDSYLRLMQRVIVAGNSPLVGDIYMVTNLDNVRKIAMLTYVKVGQFKNIFISLPNEPIKLLSAGYAVAEGSSYPTPKKLST